MTETQDGVPKEGRVARRQRRTREALIRAASNVMSEKGIDAATMLEIADRADMGAGTVYNYFRSKDDLAIAVLEEIIQHLAQRVEIATCDYTDPARIYAVALRTVMETAASDPRWKQLLDRAGIVADVMYRRLGPLASDLLRRGQEAGRFGAGHLGDDDPAMTWMLSTHAIVGSALAVYRGDLRAADLPAATVRLLCLAGLPPDEAQALIRQPMPALPPEHGFRPFHGAQAD